MADDRLRKLVLMLSSDQPGEVAGSNQSYRPRAKRYTQLSRQPLRSHILSRRAGAGWKWTMRAT